MKSVRLQAGNRPQALVFFAGWGMDDRPFRRLTSDQYDLYVCYDYRDWNPDLATPTPSIVHRDGTAVRRPFASYDQLVVVAWSFGCAVAAQFLAHGQWPVRDALAINGTLAPEDDEAGVPGRLLDATAAGLLQGGWPKFVRRMCWDQAAREDFEQHAPERDLSGAIVELDVLRRVKPPAVCGFTRAVIGTKDRIIAPANQQRCWERYGVRTRTIAAPHYPFHLWRTWDQLLSAGD